MPFFLNGFVRDNGGMGGRLDEVVRECGSQRCDHGEAVLRVEKGCEG